MKPVISVTATRTTLIEDEETVTKINFRVKGKLPTNGLEIDFRGKPGARDDFLVEPFLVGQTKGISLLSGFSDNSGARFRIDKKKASITLPTFNDLDRLPSDPDANRKDDIGVEESIFQLIKAGTGTSGNYKINQNKKDITFTFADTRSQINDFIVGNNQDNLLEGGVGDDSISGRQGNDTLFGGKDDDLLNGNGGNDFIEGGLGKDTLFGNNGNDTLFGDEGKDILFGGAGEDVLIGGVGKDAYRYTSVNDSQPNQRDSINFEQGDDLINVKAIDANINVPGNQTFIFIGSSSFSNVAGELRYNAANNLIQADVSGDGIAGFVIESFIPFNSLSASDFSL